MEETTAVATETMSTPTITGESLLCLDCNKTFLFSGADYEEMMKKKFILKPDTCPECKAKSSGKRNDRGRGGSSSNRSGGYTRTSNDDRTGTCFAFERGECQRGSSCRYVHPSSEKVGTCFAFERGECQRGSSCRYSHGSPRVSRGGSSGGGGDELGAKRPCFAFQKGECERGHACRYSHTTNGDFSSFGRSNNSGNGSSNTRTSLNKCFAFEKGECDRGDACRYSHTA